MTNNEVGVGENIFKAAKNQATSFSRRWALNYAERNRRPHNDA
jgi:hypothetical protein